MKNTFTVSESDAGMRLDKFLVNSVEGFSRSALQKLIEDGKVTINRATVAAHQKVHEDDVIEIKLPKPKQLIPKKEKIHLDIVFENEDIAILNKPAGLVIHPSDDGQNMSETLVNGLLHIFGKAGLSDIGGDLRPGIVHRLDKDTSGLIVVAKNNKIHEYLVKLLKRRQILKKYIVLVEGHISHKEGTIEAPIARSNKDRKKFAVADVGEGKDAITEYRVLEFLNADNMKFSLLEVKLITGRTHQIRVHFQSIGYPVVGDQVYGTKKIRTHFDVYGLHRQFLHAAEIEFKLPDGKTIYIKKDLPPDLEKVLDYLE